MSPTCTECSRPLRNAMCTWRHCPAYGHDVSEDDDATAARFRAWLDRNPDTAGLTAWDRFQAEEQAA